MRRAKYTPEVPLDGQRTRVMGNVWSTHCQNTTDGNPSWHGDDGPHIELIPGEHASVEGKTGVDGTRGADTTISVRTRS